MLILDSNTISYYFRGDPQVVPCLTALGPADLGVPAIVEYELRYGLLRLPLGRSHAPLGSIGPVAAAYAGVAVRQ